MAPHRYLAIYTIYYNISVLRIIIAGIALILTTGYEPGDA